MDLPKESTERLVVGRGCTRRVIACLCSVKDLGFFLGSDFCLLFTEVGKSFIGWLFFFLTLNFSFQNSFKKSQHFLEKAKLRANIKPAKPVASLWVDFPTSGAWLSKRHHFPHCLKKNQEAALYK